MPIIADSIVSDAARQLQDDTNIAWSKPELLKWLNMGRRLIVSIKPDAYVVNRTIKLEPGTLQTIPDDANVFMRLVRNRSALTNGTPGRAILPTPIQVLDEQNPNWHMDAPTATVQHFAFDERDNKHYYVYPPSNGGYADGIFGATPPDVGLNDPIGISDLFEGALYNFVMSMAYQKDSDYTRNDGKAEYYRKNAADLIAGMSTAESRNDAGNNAIGNQRAATKRA